VQIAGIRHKALRLFIVTGRPKGLNPNVAERLRKMVAYLVAIEIADELKLPPNYGAHQLTCDRAGTWSLAVTRNWRLTFRITDDQMIVEMDLEDYH
jgi:toxin HigB-1